MSFSSNPTNLCPFPFSDSTLKIPSTNYHHTTRIIETPEASTPPNTTTEVKGATIEIQVQGWYKLYVEPLKGHPLVSMEKGNYFVSPKFNYKFKIPLFLLANTSLSVSYVSKELAKLPVSSGLAMYLKPHIVQNAIALANKKSQTKEFKIVFDVKVVKIDLADNQECDGYRRRGKI